MFVKKKFLVKSRVHTEKKGWRLFVTLVSRLTGFPRSHSTWEPFWFAWHLIWRISHKYWRTQFCFFFKCHRIYSGQTVAGTLEPEYDSVFGSEIRSWAAWASSPSSSGWWGSEGLLVTVISRTTNWWSDSENTCMPSSSLQKKSKKKLKSWLQ